MIQSFLRKEKREQDLHKDICVGFKGGLDEARLASSRTLTATLTSRMCLQVQAMPALLTEAQYG
jgi:hypothetical protein